ncbi:hypothetical protein [Rothia nasimurium]|uniref:hypothetical protein n=1 Tax=Rothia nasimurium TaxID=85336 RepID=UPI001F2EE09B|nr:hypothetical protein [Rothia nasimurium]
MNISLFKHVLIFSGNINLNADAIFLIACFRIGESRRELTLWSESFICGLTIANAGGVFLKTELILLFNSRFFNNAFL